MASNTKYLKFVPNCRRFLNEDFNYETSKIKLAKPYSKEIVLSWNVDMPEALFDYLTKISSTIRTSLDIIYIKKKTFFKSMQDGDSMKSKYLENYRISLDYILVGGDMEMDHVLNLKDGRVYCYSLDEEFPYINSLIIKNETFYDYVNEYVFNLKLK